ncbi:MAG: bifunctional alpha,alpha-trehalose-phosphate synthase (UDP-forming)/trehalose-phosphatase [Spirochaetaceae bacterium]
MAKTILVSNRMSTSAAKRPDGISFQQSMGGLATGLKSLHETEGSLWVGWSGVADEELDAEERTHIAETLRRDYKSIVVQLSSEELDQFYYGFCNRTIWPLFHYFPTYTEYDTETWETYERVNQKFAERVIEVADDTDYIWVHDYHLMLLPKMLKDKLPESRIGFFLHIPFPSYEVFRLLPWRTKLLTGLLGADLVGFHTYDYARHFLSSVRRILGAEHHMAQVRFDNRMIKVDAFPMGIDYEKYSNAVDLPEVQEEQKRVQQEVTTPKLILSVDRLDYSKGIPLRLRAFHRFLELYPEYREHVTLMLIVAPSRTEVPQYRELKREIDELVSVINGDFGTIGWNPVWYYYRPAPFHQLSAIYSKADLLLVTPLRDGMNLISKEYLAARSDRLGAVVLSETAGSARELGEALTVNPNNVEQIAETIKRGIELPRHVQVEKNERMHMRLQRYDIHYWARDFMHKLEGMAELQNSLRVRKLSAQTRGAIQDHYLRSQKRLIFLDYDGTLIAYGETPGVLDNQTRAALKRLASDSRNHIVIVSGRQREFLKNTLTDIPVSIIAGHGVWVKDRDGDWELMEQVTPGWKDEIRPIFELYRDRTPGSVVEENDYSLVWHYRRAEPELAAVRLSELKDALLSLISNLDLSLLEGNNMIEIKNTDVSKGRAAARWLESSDWDFVLAVGDDWTDEDIFTMLPEHAYSIKVSVDISSAKYFLESPDAVRKMVQELAGLIDTSGTRG